jgi:hypothetical protein
MLCQIQAAGADPVPNIEDVRTEFYIGQICQLLDQLDLCQVLRFIAGQPVAVVEMLTRRAN